MTPDGAGVPSAAAALGWWRDASASRVARLSLDGPEPNAHRTSYTERVTIPLLAIGPAPLQLDRLVAAVTGAAAGSDGAVVSFLGLVRNHNVGRQVRYLEYEAYEPLALRSFQKIADEARARWPAVRLALHHRVGRLEIGEASVAIAAAAPHRAEAYAVCRYTIERVKQIAPVWKREFFDGGDVWVEGAAADPDDEGARAAAERLACA